MQYSEINQILYNLLQQEVNQQISKLLMLQQVPKLPKMRFFLRKLKNLVFDPFKVNYSEN